MTMMGYSVFDTNVPDKRTHTKKKHRALRKLKKGVAFLLALLLVLTAAWSAVIAAGNHLVDETKLAAVLNDEAYVPTDAMPDYVWQAFVAIEDHRFMSHLGVDSKAMARALWADVKARSFVQGGSTITMQLARNLFLTHDKTMSRKLKEMAIAIHLEHHYSKEQILSMYLNQIYFGHGQNGIEQAANLYFGKTVRTDDPHKETINLSEAAMLAALPKAPETYSPIKNLELTKERQELVLKRMVQLGIISEADRQSAAAEHVTIVGAGKSAA